MEAIEGVEKELTFRVKKPCKVCKGSGDKDGESKRCPKCGGRGMVRKQPPPSLAWQWSGR